MIQLDWSGRIVAANDRALELLRTPSGLTATGGRLHAVEPAEDAKLQESLAQAAAPSRGPGVASSITVRAPSASSRLVLHVSPMNGRLKGLRMRTTGAVVLLVDPARKPHINPVVVASALDLTPQESSIAVMLAKGCSIREIGAAMGRTENTIRWHLKHICAKHKVSRQAEVVRLVLAASVAATLRG